MAAKIKNGGTKVIGNSVWLKDQSGGSEVVGTSAWLQESPWRDQGTKAWLQNHTGGPGMASENLRPCAGQVVTSDTLNGCTNKVIRN